MFAALVPVLIKVGIPAAAAGLSWLVARVAALAKARTQSEVLQRAIALLEQAVTTQVDALEQSFRRAAEDGKLTAGERKQIKDEAVRRVRLQLEQHFGWIGRAFGLGSQQLVDLISDKIEQRVLALKR